MRSEKINRSHSEVFYYLNNVKMCSKCLSLLIWNTETSLINILGVSIISYVVVFMEKLIFKVNTHINLYRNYICNQRFIYVYLHQAEDNHIDFNLWINNSATLCKIKSFQSYLVTNIYSALICGWKRAAEFMNELNIPKKFFKPKGSDTISSSSRFK